MESNSNLMNAGNNFQQDNQREGLIAAAGTAVAYDNNKLKIDPAVVIGTPNELEAAIIPVGDFHEGQIPPGLLAEMEAQGKIYRDVPGTARSEAKRQDRIQ